MDAIETQKGVGGMRDVRLAATVPLQRTAEARSMDPGQPHGAARTADTGRIRLLGETHPSRSNAPEEPRPELAMDESRLMMTRREKEMSVEQRIELFERLSRDAAWARSAKRVR